MNFDKLKIDGFDLTIGEIRDFIRKIDNKTFDKITVQEYMRVLNFYESMQKNISAEKTLYDIKKHLNK